MRIPVIGRPISPSAHLLGEPPRNMRRIEWRVSLRTQMKFYDLLGELVDLEGYPRDAEIEARMEALRDDIRALPGYPRKYHPDRDLIVPVVTSEQR